MFFSFDAHIDHPSASSSGWRILRAGVFVGYTVCCSSGSNSEDHIQQQEEVLNCFFVVLLYSLEYLFSGA